MKTKTNHSENKTEYSDSYTGTRKHANESENATTKLQTTNMTPNSEFVNTSANKKKTEQQNQFSFICHMYINRGSTLE